MQVSLFITWCEASECDSVSAGGKAATELLARKITSQSRYSIWMKTLYFENGCLQGHSFIRRTSQCHVLWLLMSLKRITILLGTVLQSLNLNLWWSGTVSTQGLQVCATGAIKNHEWPNFYPKMPSWVAIPANWEVVFGQ